MNSTHRALGALCFLALAGIAQAQPIAHYQVRYLGQDQFQVDAAFAQPTTRMDLNNHEGSSRKNAQSESIRELAAFGVDGKAVPVEFVGQGTWEFKQAPATRITYKVIADHDQAKWIAGKDEVASKFDRSYYFAGDAFFLIDYEWPKRPVEVEFQLPPGWQVTSPWTSQGKLLVADEPDLLGTNAFVMGEDAPRVSAAGKLQLTWLSDSRVKAVEAPLAPVLDQLPQHYSDFWGGAPGDKLTMIFLSDPQTDGGAFKNSFVMQLATPLRPSERIVWEHTMAHELMHVWMNNSNEGVRLSGPSAYWFTEGFTDYLTVKLMREAGLIDEALAGQRYANQIRRYQLGKRLSPAISLAEAGKEKHKHWELIYGGGATFAMLLDAELSQSSSFAFRDALRAVQRQKGVAYDHAKMIATLDAHTNGRAGPLLARLEKGLTLAELRALLAPAGVQVEGFATDEVYVTFVKNGDGGN